MRHVKVFFDLEKDEDDYPPIDVESVWAIDRGDGTFEIDNIPFYARQVALGDIVRTSDQDGESWYLDTVTRSGNSLLRVILQDGLDPETFLAEIKALGCSCERSHLPTFFSINVPASTDLTIIQEYLAERFRKELLEYEEPILRQ